ncbi:MAG: hypothetical protein Kow0026_14860 [Oricola sp.]
MHARKTIIRSALAAVAAAALSQTVQASDVGTLTAEKATVSRGGVRVRAGTGIALGDRLASNASGSGVIVFEDESSARMGPNAVLTIDEFVYDPSRRSGAIRLRQSNGLARIYGGQISKRGKSEVRTPHIVLGVRGGIVDVLVSGARSVATLRGGLMVCRAGGKKRTVTNPGMSCISDGHTLTVLRLDGTGNQLVTPATGGTGTPGGGNYGGAHCASANASALCNSRDGGLPRPTTNPANGSSSGGPSGGLDAYRN